MENKNDSGQEKEVKNKVKKRNKSASARKEKSKIGAGNTTSATKKPRKARSDSVAAAVEIAQSMAKTVEPPKHVRFLKRDWPFWESVIAEFAETEWSDHTLELAALLARAMSDLEREQHMMRHEGAIIDVKRLVEPKEGETFEAYEIVVRREVNPRKQLVDMFTKNIMGIRRNLSLHARAQQGERRDVAKRRGAAKAIGKEMAQAFESDVDDLLARPSTH